jgi:hypothetical protein
MAKRRNRSADLVLAQQKAREFVLGYISNTPLGLPKELDEATFATVMDAMVRGLTAAYARGFFDGTEA